MLLLLHFHTNAPDFLPELRRNIVRMPHDDLPQLIVRISSLKDRQRTGDHRWRPAHSGTTTDESWNPLPQQRHQHLDGRMQYGLRILLAIHDREAAIHKTPRKRWHQLLDGEINHRLDSTPQDALHITKIRRVPEPKSAWKDFSHHSTLQGRIVRSRKRLLSIL